MSDGQTIIDVLYNGLGKPSFVSASATILSGVALTLIRKNKSRNDFIDKMMKMAPIDKKEFEATIQSIKEVFESKFDGVSKRLDDLIMLLQNIKK